MKFYNIHEAKDFMSKLSECDGRVDIVSDDGRTVEFMGGSSMPKETKWNYFDGTIKQIELKFQNPDDLTEMLMYVMNRRSYVTHPLHTSHHPANPKAISSSSGVSLTEVNSLSPAG